MSAYSNYLHESRISNPLYINGLMRIFLSKEKEIPTYKILKNDFLQINIVLHDVCISYYFDCLDSFFLNEAQNNYFDIIIDYSIYTYFNLW